MAEKKKVPAIVAPAAGDKKKALETAIAKIESSNLSIGNISTAESDLVAGTVIDQNIAAGTEIEEHTKISITVSSGPSGNGG